jgi:hypothetical protein
MQAPERNAARARVSRRLQDTLSQLGTGAAAALPLLLEAPSAAASTAASAAGVAASSKALTAASVAGGASLAAGASGAAGAGAGAAAVAVHPLGAWLVAFALGVGAGGGVLVVATSGGILASSPAASGPLPGASRSAVARSRLQRSPSRAAAPATSASESTSPVPEASLAEPSVAPENARSLARAPLSSAQSAGRAALDRAENHELNRAPTPLAGSLTEQQALLDRARSALSHGDGNQALAALAEHARAHPTSELAEEREALTIKSLIRASDYQQARKLAAAFSARYPHSLFLPSIRAALAQNP